MHLESGNLVLDLMGGVWRRGRMNEHETVDAVRLGSIDGRCKIEDDELEDLEYLEREWTRWHEEGRAEKDERWAEFWRSR
jgi:hypothetical protein